MKRILLLSAALIFMYSCSGPDVPADILGQKEMKGILRDMHLADAYLNSISDSDSVKKLAPAYHQKIFKIHGSDLKQFEKSLSYYSGQPELLDSLYSQIIAELNKSKGKVKQVPGLKEKTVKRSLPKPAQAE